MLTNIHLSSRTITAPFRPRACSGVADYGHGGYDNCISDVVSFYQGHIWVKGGWKPGDHRKALDDLTDEERDFTKECLGYQSPDLYSIDNTWFLVNETVPAEIVGELEALLHEDSAKVAQEGFPRHLLPYQIQLTDDELARLAV